MPHVSSFQVIYCQAVHHGQSRGPRNAGGRLALYLVVPPEREDVGRCLGQPTCGETFNAIPSLLEL